MEVYPLYEYRSIAGDLVRRFKQGRRDSLAGFFCGRLAPVIRERWPDFAIVPVPPRPEKMRLTGWDQIEAIARRLEREGFEVRRVLARSSAAEQKRLSREERQLNARKGYLVIPGAGELVPRKALILDDVVTTGATLRACAIALRESGSRTVAAVALAAD